MVEDSLYRETRHKEVHAIKSSQNHFRCSLYRDSPVYAFLTRVWVESYNALARGHTLAAGARDQHAFPGDITAGSSSLLLSAVLLSISLTSLPIVRCQSGVLLHSKLLSTAHHATRKRNTSSTVCEW